MNNNLQKALCISAICIFSGFNASYANTEIQDEYSTEHFYNLLTPNLVFPEKKAPFAVQDKLNILKTIAKKYPNDKNIQKLYHEHVGYFARENEYRYIALNELKESLKYLDQQDKLEVIRMHDQIARSYTEIWKFKEAEKEYKIISKLMNNNKNLLKDHHIINDCTSRMYYHLGNGELNKIFPLYKKGWNVLDNKPQRDINLELNLNEPIIQYYFHTFSLNNAKDALDFHWSLAQETDNTNLKIFTQKEYINYYKMMNDIDKIEKTLKEIKKLNKGKYSKDSIENIDKNIAIANAYLYIADMYVYAKDYALAPNIYDAKIKKYAQKAEKYANEAVKHAQQYKEIYPVIYALALQSSANLSVKLNKYQDAEKQMTEAIEYYKKASPELSYFLFNGIKFFGFLYREMEQYDKSIEKYKEAEKALNEINKLPYIEHAVLYAEMAKVYSKMNKETESILYANKTIAISNLKFGVNSVRALESYKKKMNNYRNLGKTELAVNEAKELLYKIKESGIDETYDIKFECYFLIAKEQLKNGQLDNALTNAKKALEASFSETNKAEANDLISEIYSQQGNKLKEIQYKLK